MQVPRLSVSVPAAVRLAPVSILYSFWQAGNSSTNASRLKKEVTIAVRFITGVLLIE
jgi:hypothetical protein